MLFFKFIMLSIVQQFINIKFYLQNVYTLVRRDMLKVSYSLKIKSIHKYINGCISIFSNPFYIGSQC